MTSNLRDFPPDALAPFGIEAVHPDDFVVSQFDLSPATVCQAVKRQRESLRKRAKTVEQYLATLSALQMPQTVERLREYASLV